MKMKKREKRNMKDNNGIEIGDKDIRQDRIRIGPSSTQTPFLQIILINPVLTRDHSNQYKKQKIGMNFIRCKNIQQ